jgi:hypothetical protein
MTKAELEAVAAELGIDSSIAKSKAELQRLIDEYTTEHGITVENEVVIEKETIEPVVEKPVENEVVIEKETIEPVVEKPVEPVKKEVKAETSTHLPELTATQIRNMSHQMVLEYNKRRNQSKK